jgi:four helix bundle protein
MKEYVVKPKSFAFALRVVKVVKYLQGEKKEFVLSKQVLRSGTPLARW